TGDPPRFLPGMFGGGAPGFDRPPDSVALAKMLAQRPRLGDKVTYRQGNALDLPFPEASFDVVWSQNAAMNIAGRDRLYGEMHRVLRPCGRPRHPASRPGPPT